MSRRVLTGALLTVALAGPLGAQRAPAAGTARAVAQRTLTALAARNAEGFAREASPQDLAAFRAQLLANVQQALGTPQRAQALAMFAPAKSFEDIQKIPAERLFAIYLQTVMNRVAAAGPMTMTNTILGEVTEGDSLSHIVYRQHIASGTSKADNVSLVSLRRTPGGWKVTLEAGQLGMGPPQGGPGR